MTASVSSRDSQAESPDDLLEIDLREYFGILAKHKWLILLSFLTAVAIAALVSYLVLPPTYSARSTLMVQVTPQNQVVRTENGLEAVVDVVSSLPRISLETYVNQIISGAMLDRVVAKLPPEAETATANALAGRVRVEAVRDTNLIHVNVTHTDPDMAARIANTMVDEYLVFLSEQNERQMARSVSFLQDQIATADAELREAENQLAELDAGPDSVDGLTHRVEELRNALSEYDRQQGMLSVEISGLSAAIRILEQRLESTPPTITVEETIQPVPPIAADSSAVQGQQAQTVRREEPNPFYVQLQSELSDQQQKLQEAEAKRSVLAAQIGAIQNELTDASTQLASKRLERERLVNRLEQLRAAVDTLNEKITEAQVAQSIRLGEANVSVISRANPPQEPVGPNKKLNMAVAGVLGGMMGVLASFLLEFFDTTIRRPEEIEALVGAPVLGRIPLFR